MDAAIEAVTQETDEEQPVQDIKRIGGFQNQRQENISLIPFRYGRSICSITLQEKTTPVSWQDICWMRMETSWRNAIPKPEFLSKILFGLGTNNDEGRRYGRFDHTCGLIAPRV